MEQSLHVTVLSRWLPVSTQVVQKHLESMKAIAKIFNQIDERKLEDKDGNTKEEPLDNKLRAKARCSNSEWA